MKTNVIYIKNMVCPRCIDVVKEICEDLKISVKDIQLGKLESNLEINNTLKLLPMKFIGASLPFSGWH